MYDTPYEPAAFRRARDTNIVLRRGYDDIKWRTAEAESAEYPKSASGPILEYDSNVSLLYINTKVVLWLEPL